MLLEAETVSIECDDGSMRDYVLSKFPAIQGREIITQYPVSGLPKLGDYRVNEALMMKLMAFVAVPREGGEPLRLTTPELINNHVPDSSALMRIEMAMMEKNCHFFRNGKGSAFFDGFVKKAMASIMSTLTGSSPSSNPND